MRCPCCDGETDKDAIVSGDSLYLADGRVISGQPATLAVLADLLYHGSIPTLGRFLPADGNTLTVHVSRLRGILRDNNVPLAIETKVGKTYVLVRS